MAARARCSQLRARSREAGAPIDTHREPATLEEAIEEAARLERSIARAHSARQDGDRVLAGHANDDTELAPLDCELRADDALGGIDTRLTRVILVAAVATSLGVAGVVALSLRKAPQRAFAAPTTPTRMHLAGRVKTRDGAVAVDVGERCDITIVESADRDADHSCEIRVACPRVTEDFVAAACPMRPPHGARVGVVGLAVDTSERYAAFMSYVDGVEGTAWLELDP